MTWSAEAERREYVPDKPYCHSLPVVSQRLWPRFDNYLRERNLDYALARMNYWFPSRTIDGYDRLVVPGSSDQPGNLYWQARLIQPVTLGNAKPTDPRRWESPHGIARGNSVCLMWPKEPRPERFVAIVEGPMDALAAAGEGFVAIALMGVNPSTEVLCLTAKLFRGTIPLIVMDINAEAAMAENQAKLVKLGLNGKLVSPYPGKDLAALDRPARREVLRIE